MGTKRITAADIFVLEERAAAARRDAVTAYQRLMAEAMHEYNAWLIRQGDYFDATNHRRRRDRAA